MEKLFDDQTIRLTKLQEQNEELQKQNEELEESKVKITESITRIAELQRKLRAVRAEQIKNEGEHQAQMKKFEQEKTGLIEENQELKSQIKGTEEEIREETSKLNNVSSQLNKAQAPQGQGLFVLGNTPDRNSNLANTSRPGVSKVDDKSRPLTSKGMIPKKRAMKNRITARKIISGGETIIGRKPNTIRSPLRKRGPDAGHQGPRRSRRIQGLPPGGKTELYNDLRF